MVASKQSPGAGRLLPAAAAALLIRSLLLAPAVHGQPTAPEGTYAIWICENPCALADSSRATVSGHLVLGSTISRSMIPDDVRSYLTDRSVLMGNRGAPNACFVLRRHTRFPGTFAGIIPVALTRWRPFQPAEGDSLSGDFSIGFYASPDAFSTFYFSAEGDTLGGRGRSSGYIGEPFLRDDGYLAGRRTGAADPELCYEAARALLR